MKADTGLSLQKFSAENVDLTLNPKANMKKATVTYFNIYFLNKEKNKQITW